jgi:hypothetical protein
VNPVILAIESIRVFVAEELKVGEVRLAPELSEAVADLVLRNAAEPASLRRAATEFVYLPHGREQRLLHEILGNFPLSHADQRVAIQAGAVIIDPPIRIGLRCKFGRCGWQGLKAVHRGVSALCQVAAMMPIEVVPLERVSSAREQPSAAKVTQGA